MNAEIVRDEPELLAELPYVQRRVLQLLHVEGVPIEDVARRFNTRVERARQVEAQALVRLVELREDRGWSEPTSVARYLAGGGLLHYDGPLSLVAYHSRLDPENPSVREELLCPPTPIGSRLEVDRRRGLWRHVPAEG